MKNKLLPIGFLSFLLGFSFLLFSNLVVSAVWDGQDSDPSGNDRMHRIRSNQNSGVINPLDVVKTMNEIGAMNTKATAGLGLNWMQVGPSNYAGRSRVVMYDNQDPTGQTIYTGGVTGGLYRSVSNGLTWNKIEIGSEILRVSAITQLQNGTIYVGTGESFCGEGDYMGTGLYRSTDGLNFTSVSSTHPVMNDPLSEWAFVTKLANNPSNGRIFAATSKSLKYSDNGDTWNDIMTGYVMDVVVGSDGTVAFSVDGMVYIAHGGDLGNLVNVSTGAPDMLPDANVSWVELAIAPSDPNILYASIAETPGDGMLGIYRSGDNGATWETIFPDNPSFNPLGSAGCYANTLAVFPDNPDKVLLGGLYIWLGEKVLETGFFNWETVWDFPLPFFHHDYMFNPINHSQFAVASDNGISIGTITGDGFLYQTSNRNLITSQFNSVSMTRINKWIMGGALQLGTQLFNAVHVNDPLNGYIIPQSYYTGTFCEWSQLKTDYIFFSGTGFDGGAPYIRSEDLGETSALSFLDGITSTITQYLPSKLWETDFFPYSKDSLKLKALEGEIKKDSVVTMLSRNCLNCSFEYTVPQDIPTGDSTYVMDPYHSRFFMYGTKSGYTGIYMTQDAIKFYKEPSWYLIGEIETENIVSCLALSEDLNYLYAGTENGILYRFSNLTLALDSATADIGSPYCIIAKEMFTLPEFTDRYITNMAFNPSDDEQLLVTLGNYGNNEYVYLSQNALDSIPAFTSVQGNLPPMPVYDALFELNEDNYVIVGADFGVYSTSNVFANPPQWSADLNGMGNLPVTDLEQQTWVNYSVQNIGVIAAASYGRGLFYDTTFFTPLGINPPAQDGTGSGTLAIHPNPAGNTVNISCTLKSTEKITVQVFDLTGRMVIANENGIQNPGRYTTSVKLGTLPEGTYIIRVNNMYGKVVKLK
jgi:hypothetical protein